MIINAKHRSIIAAVTALYSGKGFELDGKNLKRQTEAPEELEDLTQEEGEAILNHTTKSA